jgi:chromosomal replication initiator protein
LSTTYDVVAVLAQAISQRIGEPRYNLWFQGKTKFLCNEDQLTIGVPNLFLQDWLQKKFAADVRAAVDEVLGVHAALRFHIDPQLFQADRAQQREVQTHSAPANAEPHAPHAEPRRPLRERRWRSLSEFVVGACNRVAHASAVSLVEAPDECPIPLVMHGAVGTGKTHLLEGVCAGLKRKHADWKILFVTAEDFTNRFVQAMHQQKLAGFRKMFRSCDTLLVDDVGFLARKQATQEEFLHTLDALSIDHRPIVLATDCHPRLADHFLPELTDRLVGGAVWGLTTPDRGTRLDMLRLKTTKLGGLGGLPEAVLDYLADNLRGNVRELESAINSILHLGKTHERPIDVELAREAIGDLVRHSLRFVTLDQVEHAICEVLGISKSLLFSKKRHWVHAYPRMVAMYLARVHTSATFSEIGKHFGGRNHSTVVAAEKKVRDWLKTNLTLQLGTRTMPVRDIVERIERLLEA